MTSFTPDPLFFKQFSTFGYKRFGRDVVLQKPARHMFMFLFLLFIFQLLGDAVVRSKRAFILRSERWKLILPAVMQKHAPRYKRIIDINDL